MIFVSRSLRINTPQLYEEFTADQIIGNFDRVFIEASAHPNVLSQVQQFQHNSKYQSILFTDSHGNSVELDTSMKHVIANYKSGRCSFADLPSEYHTYNIFVDGMDVTRGDVEAIMNFKWAQNVLIYFKQFPSPDFLDEFNHLKETGKLANVYVEYAEHVLSDLL